ncbi:MAG: TlpA family protein disulfide reductase [Desulfococcaceae bacterium]
MKNFFILLILGAMFLLTMHFFRPSGNYAGLSPPSFPENLSSMGKIALSGHVTSMEGRQFPLSELEGKVVFLGFWATWCPPCKAEMPSVQNLYNAMKEEKDVVFMMVSDEENQIVRNFMGKNRYDFPVYLADGSLSSRLKVEAIPTTFIIDRKGDIVFAHTGAARWDDAVCADFLKKM